MPQPPSYTHATVHPHASTTWSCRSNPLRPPANVLAEERLLVTRMPCRVSSSWMWPVGEAAKTVERVESSWQSAWGCSSCRVRYRK